MKIDKVISACQKLAKATPDAMSLNSAKLAQKKLGALFGEFIKTSNSGIKQNDFLSLLDQIDQLNGNKLTQAQKQARKVLFGGDEIAWTNFPIREVRANTGNKGDKTYIRWKKYRLKQKTKSRIKTNNAADILEQKMCYGISRESADYLAINFDSKKARIIQLLEKYIPANSKYMKKLRKANTSDDFAELVSVVGYVLPTHSQKPLLYSPIRKAKQSVYTLEDIQNYNRLRQEYAEVLVEIQKVLNNPTKDRRILEIENLIKTKYGIKYVHLDNMDEAKKSLEALEIAKKNGIPMPEDYIVTRDALSGYAGLNCTKMNGKHSIIIQSDKAALDNYDEAFAMVSSINHEGKKLVKQVKRTLAKRKETQYSTQHPLHVHLHELIHNESGFDVLPQLRETKVLTLKKDIIAKVSNYANQGIAEEARTELRVKQLLVGLSKEEEEVLYSLTHL